MYLVKWEGFSINESTWEPEDNVQDLSLLFEYKTNPPKIEPYLVRFSLEIYVLEKKV